MKVASEWSDSHSAELKRLVENGLSYSDSCAKLNRKFGTSYSRSACIGRSKRMKDGPNPPPKPPPIGAAELSRRRNIQRREKRWAENPSLAQRAQRLKEAKETRAKMIASNTSKTSQAYRKHLPKLPAAMTRSELRAMLTQAIQNTAAMEVA